MKTFFSVSTTNKTLKDAHLQSLIENMTKTLDIKLSCHAII